ncbi:hypothetical protein [Streptomyces sp. NPDC057494]|uniref:hypothetical protein n=1 Tax=Streptomyces sp. NPDC057494 TaxID=3346148 RepID=UPI00368DC7B0
MTRLLRKTTGGTTGTAEAAETDGGESPDTADDPRPEAADATGPELTEATASETTEATASETASSTSPEVSASAEGDATSAADGAGVEPSTRTGRRSTTPWRRIALAAGLAALLLGGSWFFYAAHQLRTTPSARNHALTDTTATDRVSGDVADGLARVFSYTPGNTDAAERSSRTVLAGRAARQYGELLAQVRANLVEQRITLSTQAVRTGVIELDGDSARLLVFLDQTSRRDKGAATSAAAQLTVTAKFQGDRWQIVDIKAR